MTDLLTDEFRTFSARLGRDPLRVQGAGGNTSIKADGRMWVKASGTELAAADIDDVFVEVDHEAALAEAHGAGDGTCKTTVIDPAATLRPSIETTFHAALAWPVVAHTHSIATITHAISPQGRRIAAQKLEDLPVAFAAYRKPGISLTGEILSQVTAQTRVIVLENHGLIVCGRDVAETAQLMDTVEARLELPARNMSAKAPAEPPPDGFEWLPEAGALGTDSRAFHLARAGSYYPDHVVFLGPALPAWPANADRPAVLVEGKGVLVKSDATSSQRAMLTCLTDILARIPDDWEAAPIGPAAEAELLDWDAEKYRQALSGRS